MVWAFHATDSIGLARATPPLGKSFGVFTTGKFTPADTFVRIESFIELLRYARARARRRERITLEAVQFYGWARGRALRFMPYFLRSADDLGSKPLAGIGKAEYRCGQGIVVLNLAPRSGSAPLPER